MTRYLQERPDLYDFVRALSKHNVQYMVVGGHAVGFHAVPRATKDLDVWIEPGAQNRARIVKALEDYGAPQAIIYEVTNARADEIVWFGRSPNRIDLIQTLPGVEFGDAMQRAVYAESGDQKIPVIGIDDLILNKQAVGRDQDLADVKALEKSLKH